MPLREFESVAEIKDPLHGYIPLSATEKSLIDLRAAQRLRQIRSPAGVFLVFHGADTSLMGKMLGFVHVTHILMEDLEADPDDVQRARLTALFLSLASGPWVNITREYLSVRGLSRLKLAELIARESKAGDVLQDSDFSRDEIVTALRRGVPVRGVRFNLEDAPINPELVDNLERDSYFTGVEYAQLEFRRLFQATRVAKNKIAVERGSLFTFESYLSAGANMFDAVYYHKTVRAAELMLLRTLDEAGSHLMMFPRDNLDEFLTLDDMSFMDQLLNCENDASDEMRRAHHEYTDYHNRYLIKMAAQRAISDVSFLNTITSPDGLYKVEGEIAEDAGIDQSNVYVDYPNRESVSFYPGMLSLDDLVFFERGSKGYEFWPVEDISLLARSFARQMKLIRVYTTRGYRAKVKKSAERLLESVDTPGSPT